MNAMQNCQNFDFWFQCNNMDQESTQQYNVVNCLSKMSSEEVVKKEVGKDMSNKDYREVNKEVSKDVEMDGSNPDASWKNWETSSSPFAASWNILDSELPPQHPLQESSQL